MNPIFRVIIVLNLMIFSLSCRRDNRSGDNYESVLRDFKNPPVEYRSMPLWVWNDSVTHQQIKEQLADFKAKGFGGVFVHPRPGLITPYLSEEWFSLFQYAVETGKELGMKIWIYDENSYPSGFAGGHVPSQMPESAGKAIKQEAWEIIPDSTPEIIAVFKREGDQFLDITMNYKSTGKIKGLYYVYHLVKASNSPWYGGFTYVDLMRPEVTKKFLSLTHEAYKSVAGHEFGKTIPGSFQDEAHVFPAQQSMAVNYTPALFNEFRKRWGYDLEKNLPLLFEDQGNYKTIRYHFYKTILDLFIKGWAIPYRDYCTENNLIFTGHYWEHEWPVPSLCPDNMVMASYSHMPGVDILFNQFGNEWGGQFGLDRSVKELRSLGNQLGHKRLMSETYGGSGWEITFADQKRIADWQFVLGINFVNQHLSYMSMVGTRKNDYPQSFSYQEPWWESYRVMADYLARMSVFATRGKQKNHILVLEPTSWGWMHYSPDMDRQYNGLHNSPLAAMTREFHHFLRKLEISQVEYDLGAEGIIRDHGSVKNRKFIVGNQDYDLLVLPYYMECIDSSTFLLLEKYLATGGTVAAYRTPSFIEGYPSNAVEILAGKFPDRWIEVKDSSDITLLINASQQELQFKDNKTGLLYHHRRQLADAQMLLLVNSSDQEDANGIFSIHGKSLEQWDAFTGNKHPYPFLSDGNKITCSYNIPPKGSLLLCIKNMDGTNLQQYAYDSTYINPLRETEIKRNRPNVLALDYCDVKMNGLTRSSLYFYEAQTLAYQQHGWNENPWDHAVQFQSEIIDADTFKAGSGIEVHYHFQVEKGVESGTMQAVVEQPDRFRITINGVPVSQKRDTYWLDKDFACYEIGPHVKKGRNTIALKAEPFTLYAEIEPVFILGNFSVDPSEKAFFIAPEKSRNQLPWKQQGMPFYPHDLDYTQSYQVNTSDADKYLVRLGNWDGTVAEVLVNKTKAGIIISPPFELDITDRIQSGDNVITVRIFGSLKNALGPHHNAGRPGLVTPWSWRYGAANGQPEGNAYGLLNYGLYEPFQLIGLKSTSDAVNKAP